MNYAQRIRLAILLAAILAVLVSRTAGATGTSHFTCGGWTVVPSPSPFTLSFLLGVAAVSPSDVWAVGEGSADGTSYQTLIEHWNGTSWQVVPSPNAQGEGLEGVTALAANNIWAVGSSKHGAQTLTVHWDGTQWRVIPSPNGGKYANNLVSVAAVSPSDIWAVGTYTTLNYNYFDHTLIEHWNGSKWSIVPSPNPGSGNNNLTGVTAVSSTDVWAVGYYYNVNSNQYSLLTEHWNGTRWSVVQAAPGTGNFLNFQAVTSTDASHVWAVGSLTNQGGSLFERWNGSRWQIVSSPPNSQFVFLYGVAASSSASAWAVGGGESTVTMHWNGTKWSTVASPNGPNFANELNGVTMPSAHSAWAVGFSEDTSTYVSSTLIEYYC